MKQIIYKYQLEITDHQTIKLPEGFEIISVKMQNGIPCIWCLVDLENREVEHDFEIFGTGHPISTENVIERNYLGTYFLDNGLVFHLFEHTGF